VGQVKLVSLPLATMLVTAIYLNLQIRERGLYRKAQTHPLVLPTLSSWTAQRQMRPLAAGDIVIFSQRFEGQDLQHLQKGTSSAKSLTASFWVKSSKTGTYILEIDDNDNARNINKSYTVNAANTWEYKTITFEGDTTGTLDNDNGFSFRVIFWLAAGSDWSSGTLATSWGPTTNANRAVGNVNLADSTSNEFYITGVQLEVGTVATEFEHRSYGEELALCQRYFQYYENPPLRGVVAGSASGYRMAMVLPVVMRANPSLTLQQTGSTSHFRVYDGSITSTYSSFNASYLKKEKIELDVNTTSSSLTLGRAACVYETNVYKSAFLIDAEL
jgi:hypothetical protein